MEKIYLNPFSITSARLRCLGATLLMLLFAVAAGPVAAREQAAEAQQPTNPGQRACRRHQRRSDRRRSGHDKRRNRRRYDHRRTGSILAPRPQRHRTSHFVPGLPGAGNSRRRHLAPEGDARRGGPQGRRRSHRGLRRAEEGERAGRHLSSEQRTARQFRHDQHHQRHYG